jgi:hypothetical protein
MIKDDLTGKRFGKIIVVGFSGCGSSGRFIWNCLCDCGQRKSIMAQSLRSGLTRSCGCSKITHRMSKSQEYAIWAGMLARCSNPNVECFADYGGRGIKVCDIWANDFLAFYLDVGPRPSKTHSLEREDSDGNYEPGNVRWATVLEQANNKRGTRFVEYRGERLALSDAVRAAGSVIHYEAAWVRIQKCGWAVDRAVETPRTRESPNSKSRRRVHA